MRTLRRLDADHARLMAPRLLLEEVGNALLLGVRRGRWTGAAADEAFADLLSLPLHLLDDHRDLERGWELARRYDNHPLYDMLYVAVAERNHTVLITTDENLRGRLARVAWVTGPDPEPGR